MGVEERVPQAPPPLECAAEYEVVETRMLMNIP